MSMRAATSTAPDAWMTRGAAAVPTSPVAEASVILFPVTLTVPLGKPGSGSMLPVALKTTSPPELTVPTRAPEPRFKYTPWLPAWTLSTPPAVRLAFKGWVAVPAPLVVLSVRLFVVIVADEVWVTLGAVIVVSPRSLVMFPARMTGSSEVILTSAWDDPVKSMPIGLSALTELVRVSCTSVAK